MTYMGDEHDNQSGLTTFLLDEKSKRKTVLSLFKQFKKIQNYFTDLDNYLFGQRKNHVFCL